MIDVVEHGRLMFEQGGLRALLESSKVIKVLHDCRYSYPHNTVDWIFCPLANYFYNPTEEIVMRYITILGLYYRTYSTHKLHMQF